MLYTYVATALIAALVAFSTGWKVQAWRYDSAALEARKQAQADERENRKTEREDANNVIGALNDSKNRETSARAAAADARTERDRLRNDLAQFSADVPGDTLETCRKRTATVRGLFDQCVDSYQEMAGTAQRHANDTLTLEKAWPRAKP